MKTIIFIGSHKEFSGLRLGAALGAFLAAKGQEVLLSGAKKELPAYLALPVLPMPTVPTVKNLAAVLKRAGVQKVISLAHLPSCQAAVELKIPFVYVEPENLKEEKLIFQELTEEEIKLAGLIGILHDVARFEQWKKFKNFSDKTTGFDHGDEAAKMLENKEFLRRFVDDDKDDDLIIKAVRNHNKYKIEEGLNEREFLHAKIIRDADKLDIFMESVEKMYLTPEMIIATENSYVSESYYSQFMKEIQIKRVPEQTALDMIISYVAFIYDIIT